MLLRNSGLEFVVFIAYPTTAGLLLIFLFIELTYSPLLSSSLVERSSF